MRSVCGGVLVLVASLQAPGAPLVVTFALISALQVAMVYGDEEVAALLLWDRPVRGGGGQVGQEARSLLGGEVSARASAYRSRSDRGSAHSWAR